MGIANLSALLACGIAMGFGAIGSGWGLGYTAHGALRGMAKQPKHNSTTFRNMLVGQAITETPAIFSLVVAFLLYFSADRTLEAPNSLAQAVVFMATGLCIGIGSIGSGIGSGIVAHEAMEGIARNPSAQGQVMLFMLIGQAWAQTGGIFALVISLLLINSGGFAELSSASDPHLWSLIPVSAGEIFNIGRYLGSGLAMGFGAIGSSIGIAFVAGMACKALSMAPEANTKIKTAFFVGSATAQSPTIFSLIVSLILLIRGS